MTPDLEGLGLVELLDLLEPAPEPPVIAWTPQTGGWIWLGVIVAIALAVGLRKIVRARRANAYRRAGLRALNEAGDDPAQIAQVLRRTALAGFPRTEVAGLVGGEWLAFLDRSGGGGDFSAGPGAIFAEAPYRPVTPDAAATTLARNWIRHHRRPTQKGIAA